MKVKILTSHPSHPNPAGSVCDMPDDMAEALLAVGAIDIDSEAIANPTADAVESVIAGAEEEPEKPKKGKK